MHNRMHNRCQIVIVIADIKIGLMQGIVNAKLCILARPLFSVAAATADATLAPNRLGP